MQHRPTLERLQMRDMVAGISWIAGSLTVGDASAFNSPPVGALAAAAPLATPTAVFATVSSVARSLLSRAVAAVMVARPPMPKVLPWVRRAVAAILSAVPGQEAKEQRQELKMQKDCRFISSVASGDNLQS